MQKLIPVAARRVITTRRMFGLGLAVLAILSAWVGRTSAYETWSVDRTTGNCATCHGDFRALNYTSANDGVAWNTSLHDGHRNADKMLNRDCNTCHVATRFPVSLNSSTGGTGFAPISCAGCHARPEPAAGGAVSGAGLRQHHWKAGEQGCGASGCHTDANPANFTTAGENVAPSYYFTPDAAHPLKPTSPCNTNGSESTVAPPLGLDNNGNNIYDALDPTCSVTDVGSGTPWAGLVLESVGPNPTFGRMRIAFALATSDPASIEMLDISGRRVSEREVGFLGAGRHALDLQLSSSVAPGMYMVRLRQGGRVLIRSVIVRR